MREASRRAFLRAAVLGVATIAVPGATGGAAAAVGITSGPTRLRRHVFAPHVGSAFLLSSGGRTYRTVLTEVSDSTRAKGHDSRFGLTFRMAGGARPPEGIYRVTHRWLPAFDLYVGAIGRGEAGLYEAVVDA